MARLKKSVKKYVTNILMCRWFASCSNPATHTQSHPILGDVPICDRCQAWYDKMGEK